MRAVLRNQGKRIEGPKRISKEARQTNPFPGVRAQRQSPAPMVTLSQGTLPAGPNIGENPDGCTGPGGLQTVLKHQAQAAGGSRAPRSWAENSQQAEPELHWVRCTAGAPGQVHCKRMDQAPPGWCLGQLIWLLDTLLP